jgi:hypothetical protein
MAMVSRRGLMRRRRRWRFLRRGWCAVEWT